MENVSSGDETEPGGSHKGYFRIACVLVVLVILLVIFQYGIPGMEDRAGLIATPQPFTQLYFSQPNALPKALSQNERSEVSFVIVNHEGSSRVFHWTADFVHGAAKFFLASGTTDLKNNGSRRIVIELYLRGDRGSGIVAVALVSPHQSINFHLTVTS